MGPILYQIFEKVTFFSEIESTLTKRVVLAAAAGVVSLAAWGLALWLGYMPQPSGNADWAEALWQNGILTAFSAFTSATLVHGYVKGPAS